MSTPIVLYTNPMSRGRVVRWMLEEIGCPYEARILEYGTTMKAPEYLAINPMGKVPALRHGDTIITETDAICTYLAEIFPDSGLAPAIADHKARAEYLRWLFYVAGPLETAVTAKAFGFEAPKDKQGSVGFGSFDLALGVIEDYLKGKDYLAGNRFSAADLVMSSYLGFYTMFGVIPPNAEFARYVGLHKNRPAFLRAEQIDNDLAPKKAC